MKRKKEEYLAERLYPETVPKIALLSHLFKYEFIKNFINRDKLVLDVGCGCGYGSNYISNSAKSIIGIDKSKEAINYAKSHYKKPKFLVMDACNLKFKKDHFDIVVSFDVIEHVDDYRKFLTSIKRVLKNKGIFIVATPNRMRKEAKYNKRGYRNPFHTKEFTFTEFCSALKEFFDVTEIYGQDRRDYSSIQTAKKYEKKYIEFVWHLFPSKIREHLLKIIFGIETEKNFNLNSYELKKRDIDNSADFIAVCKK